MVRTPLRTEIHVVVRHPEREMPQVEPQPGGDRCGPHAAPDTLGRLRGTSPEGGRLLQPNGGSPEPGGALAVGGRKPSLAKERRREKERAVQADFRLAHHLVQTYDGIAVENLNVAGMLRSKRFSKKMSEQRWSSLGNILEYKAEKAGTPFERVDPKQTTTGCASCGHRQPMPLGIRVFHCRSCGMCAGRDLNAAMNIRARGFPGSGGTIPDARNKPPLQDGHPRVCSGRGDMRLSSHGFRRDSPPQDVRTG